MDGLQNVEVKGDENQVEDKGHLPLKAFVNWRAQCELKFTLPTRLAAFQTTARQARQQAVLTAWQATALERRQQVCLYLQPVGALGGVVHAQS